MGVVVQPTGTVTLLFSDIEGSTRLLQRLGRERYAEALDLHRRLLRAVFERHGGYEVDCEGDAFFVAFARAEEAVAAAAEAQQALAKADWPEGEPVRVRMGLHTGEPLPAPPKYVGLDVHQAARVMAAGHGGQVLVSEVTRRLLEQEPDRFSFRDLGQHRLKDLSAPQRLYQLLVEGLECEFPALKTLESRRTNLPVQPNRLIGREQELAEITGRLRERTRLLTLTGPGGTGKTRLALEAAAELVDDFPDGVFFVSLASVRDPALLLPTVAQTLGLREEPGETIEETMHRYLAGKRLLLLLDNVEQLLDAAPALARLLGAAPAVALLVTSRESLRLLGEHAYPVEPLATPSGEEATTPAATLEHASVTLFVERAKAVRPDFELTTANTAAVAAICRRLDGLPLAVELAAARVRALSAEAISKRLDQSLKLLTGGARDADERQQTLRATIDWSHQLLTNEEKTLFARLSVFAGGCRLYAAEAVCDPDRELGGDVFEGLASLVDKSLLRQRDDPDGEPRYWMYETIREYASEALGLSDDLTPTLERRSHYYVCLAEDLEDKLHGPRQLEVFPLLDQEHANLREVAAFDEEAALHLLASLWRFYERRGDMGELLRLFDERLREGASAPHPIRMRALFAFARLLFRRGDYERARAPLLESLDLGERSDDVAVVACACAALGWIAEDREERLRFCTRSIEAARLAAEPWIVADALNNLGSAYLDISDYEAARAAFTEALEIREEIGELEGTWACLMNLGQVDLETERLDSAKARFTAALGLARTRQDEWEEACSHERLACVAVADGDRVAVKEHAQRASEIAERAGYRAIHDDLRALRSAREEIQPI